MDYIHFETEADVRRHLGQCQPRKTPYERACGFLELADARFAKAFEIYSYPREARWLKADRKARATALAAVEDSRLVHQARALAFSMSTSGSTRDYAKAVAARIETERSVWADAYGRAMPREWRKKP
jgi:hypothetical protein